MRNEMPSTEDFRHFTKDVSREGAKQFARAKDNVAALYDEAHGASKEYPHVTIALAAGLGFLLGIMASRR